MVVLPPDEPVSSHVNKLRHYLPLRFRGRPPTASSPNMRIHWQSAHRQHRPRSWRHRRARPVRGQCCRGHLVQYDAHLERHPHRALAALAADPTMALGLKLRDGAFVGHTSIKGPGTQGNRKHALDAELPRA